MPTFGSLSLSRARALSLSLARALSPSLPPSLSSVWILTSEKKSPFLPPPQITPFSSGNLFVRWPARENLFAELAFLWLLFLANPHCLFLINDVVQFLEGTGSASLLEPLLFDAL